MRLSFGLAVLAAGVVGGTAHADCKLDTLAELPIVVRGDKPLIAVKVNGQPEQLIVDSGTFSNMLTPRGAERAGIALHPGPASIEVFGMGGSVQVRIGTAKLVEMGNVPIPDLDFLVAGTLGAGADGLIGQNVLRVVDVEYDLAHNVMRLIKPKGCERAALGYWAKDEGVGVIALEPQSGRSPYAIGSARVNGSRVRVLLDTGAAVSVLSAPAAERAGVPLQGEGVRSGGRMVGVDHRPMQTWIAPVEAFEVGGEQVKNTRLRVGGGGVAGIDLPDMVLGLDFFRSHRVYVSNSQHKVYFTYAGGPVFNLSQDPGAAAPPAESKPPAS